MTMSYLEAISLGFPGVQCHMSGDVDLYENIVWDAGVAIPEKITLDQWILSNNNNTVDKKITVLAFRNRFSLTEKVGLDLGSIDDPTASMETRKVAATLRVMMKDIETALFIDLDDPITRSGVQMMEQIAIIAPGRSTEILDTPITSLERPVIKYY